MKECVAEPKNGKAAGADEIVNEFSKYWGVGGMATLIVVRYHWIYENECTPERWREGSALLHHIESDSNKLCASHTLPFS